MDYNKAALEMHETHKGKVGIVSKVEVATRDDLSTAYTPGVAEPCRKIKENPDDVYKYTFKGNMVAVVSNGTAVLGLGDIGPEAGLPVMEGKAVLFKEFGGVDAFPICIDAHDAASVIAACKAIAPTFGGINLEDIKSPECFEIEETLERELDIPVFHDDQHVSRTHPGLVKRLFELEVPEIYDGTVEIKSISREAGSRTKLAVWSADPNVDPIGACVGPRGQRVNTIVEELKGEKMDIIKWSEDPEAYIAAALAPSDVISVEPLPDGKSCRVVVPDDQLSLAIGKEGQNARLAAKLTGYKIDIKPASAPLEPIEAPEEDLFAEEAPIQAPEDLEEAPAEEAAATEEA